MPSSADARLRGDLHRPPAALEHPVPFHSPRQIERCLDPVATRLRALPAP